MRVVFLGTPEPAAIALEVLLDSRHEVAAVVTQPDRPAGRGREPHAPPVKALAAGRGIPVMQPGSPKEEGFAEALGAFEPEALAVVAYGHILPRDVLAVAPAVNVHFSLLPRYRGAAPVQRALMDGATATGVTTFLLEPTVDTGPIIGREQVHVGPEETAGELLARLAPIGARLLITSLDGLEAGTAEPLEQESALACPAPKIRPEEALVDWAAPAGRIVNLIRALNPTPVAWTTLRGRRLNLWRARPASGDGEPGTVLEAGKDVLLVAAGEEAVELLEVQPEGKRRMDAAEFGRGYRPAGGERLGRA